MFVLNFFIYEKDEYGFDNDKYIDFIVDWLNKKQDKKNGLWNLGNKVSYHNQMAAAFHFLFFYTYLDKNPNNIKEMVQSTLAVQDFDGLFNYAGGGGACDDLDGIDILCRATFTEPLLLKELYTPMKLSHHKLMMNQNDDGGFCWAKRNDIQYKKILLSCNIFLLFKTSFKDFISNGKMKILNQIKVFRKKPQTWSFSGIKSMEIEISESDIFSTWFRLLSIATIEETFPKISKQNIDWNFRKSCGIGFYKKK